jgi:hypothetical protein
VEKLGAKFCPDVTKYSESYEQNFVPATKRNVTVTVVGFMKLRHNWRRFVNLFCDEFYENATKI